MIDPGMPVCAQRMIAPSMADALAVRSAIIEAVCRILLRFRACVRSHSLMAWHDRSEHSYSSSGDVQTHFSITTCAPPPVMASGKRL